MLEELQQIDFQMFNFINQKLSNPFFDFICPWLRNPMFWSPLYLFILVYMLYHFRWKGFYWILFFLVAFAFSDIVSASIIKPWVGRLRPCNDVRFDSIIHLLISCGPGKSFPSSHATNHFCISTFMYFTLRKNISKSLQILLFAWAAAVSFSQIYVGVHFPFDVFVGALLGIFIGWLVSFFYKKTMKKSIV